LGFEWLKKMEKKKKVENIPNRLGSIDKCEGNPREIKPAGAAVG